MVAIGTFLHARDRAIVPSKYDWLDVLSHTKWSTGRDIANAMRARTNSKNTFGGIMYTDLSLLEQEDLVESLEFRTNEDGLYYTYPIFKYRLTSDGLRARLEKNEPQPRSDNSLAPL